MNIKTKAKLINANIVIPEANIDDRIYTACKFLARNNWSKITVLGKPGDFDDFFVKNKNVTVINIENYAKITEMTKALYERRKDKLQSLEEAAELLKNPIYFATMLLYSGACDGMVCGANYSTADSLRPALQIIKGIENKMITSSILMVKNKKVFVFADCALNIEPDEELLSEIAIASADFFKNTLNKEPSIAMLSYSTDGSGKGENPQKIKAATEIIKQKRNDLRVCGEVQVDAALDKKVAKRKGIEFTNANVLIFPDLNSGNIGYKLVKHFGRYMTIGPICHNFNKPVNDLSRGCTIADILSTVLITKLQTKKE